MALNVGHLLRTFAPRSDLIDLGGPEGDWAQPQ